MNLEGRELGGCKLLRKLGAGGMGEVYLAEQRRVGNRQVAVKVVSPDDTTFRPDVAEDLARRFQREAALLGNLSHPNILPVHDSGVEGGLLYLVMEYAPEGSLADAIRGVATPPLSLPVGAPLAVDIIGQVAAALQFTHEQGVVHRDVKPANVLIRIELDGHWRMLLADFGVARGTENTSQRTQITGTFAYMAPEQFSGKFSPASDQYALGVMAFQLLTGRLPFEGDLASLTRAHMYEPPPAASAFNPALPAAVDAVLQRALAKDPAERYPGVAAFAEALKGAVGVGGMTDQTTRPVPPPILAAPAVVTAPGGMAQANAATSTTARARRRLRPGRVVVTLLAAAVLLVGVLGGTALLNYQRQQDGKATPSPTSTQIASTAASSPPVTPSLTQAPCPNGTTSSVACAATPSVPSGQLVVNDPAPNCDSSAQGAGWQMTVGTKRTCGQNGLTLTATTTNLACMNATQQPIGDGYASATVVPTNRSVVLAFRQNRATSGSTFNITGYYFWVFKSDSGYDQFALYEVDTTHEQPQAVISQRALPGTLNLQPGHAFVMTAAFVGSQITLSINGMQVGSTTDTRYTAGWFGICTDGAATFTNAQLYKSGS